MKGIDVSQWNGRLDWESLKEQGIEFAILRCGIGNDETNQDDTEFIRNVNECILLEIPFGVYIYSYALNMDEVESEVDHILRLCDGLNPQLGLWLDMEDADGYKERNGLRPEDNGDLLTDFCNHWLEIIEDRGFKAGIYCNLNYYRNILSLNTDTRLWLACWIDEEPITPPVPCEIWQYSSSQEFDGVRLDTNISYINLETEEQSFDFEKATIILNDKGNKKEIKAIDFYNAIKIGAESYLTSKYKK